MNRRHGTSALFPRPMASVVGGHLVGPDLEADERIGSERRSDGDVDGVAAPGHQHPSDPWRVVAGVEGVPATSEIGLEPGGEIHRAVGRGHSDVAKITGAVARRHVQAPAQHPEPTTATDFPVLAAGGSGFTQPSAKARSMMVHSIVLMVTGLSSMLSVRDASHGAGH